MILEVDSKIPLVADLDGTLIRQDIFQMQMVSLITRKPFVFFKCIWLILTGRKLEAKALVATGSSLHLSLENLAPNTELIESLRSASEVRPIYVATGSHVKNTSFLKAELGFLSGVFASEETNLTGKRKGELLAREFGLAGFDYIGDSTVDRELVPFAKQVIFITHPLRGKGKALARMKALVEAMRLRHAVKNLLVFVPLLTSHEYLNLGALASLAVLFLALSLVTSANYLVNDILDLPHDVQHPTKRYRAIASGLLPISQALVIATLLIALALAIAFLALAWNGVVALIGYLMLANVYTLWLKRRLVLDVTALAGLYVYRVTIGTWLTGLDFSIWLFGFIWLLFFSLSWVKRASENSYLESSNGFGRGYRVEDKIPVVILGIGSSYAATTFFALYASSDQAAALYSIPILLTACIPILVSWFSILWIKAYRGEVIGDPVEWVLRDKTSLLLGALFLAVVGLSL